MSSSAVSETSTANSSPPRRKRISLRRMTAASSELLISHADQAMYQAKHGGKNRWQVYRKVG